MNGGIASARDALQHAISLFDLRRFAAFVALWLVISVGDAPWLVGLAATLLATAASVRLFPIVERRVHWARLMTLGPRFAWESVLGGIDVARRALHPDMPLDPGWVRYEVRLPRGAARVSLGGIVSIMPGTLAAAGASPMLIHALDQQQPIVAQTSVLESQIAHVLNLGWPHA